MSPKKPNFRHVNVLVADSDSFIARAVTQNLRVMGFGNVKYVKTAAEAVEAMRTQPISFMITEWDLKGTTGLDLVRYMRRGTDSPNRALPIIMLSARGEQPDVESARDVGINEFVVKPFSAKSLFSRIEQLVDHPRNFVMAKSYVGPERRRRGLPPPGMADRRVIAPDAQLTTRDALKAPSSEMPKLFMPDQALRQALGTSKPLSELITPDILRDAQHSLTLLSESSMQWIMEDLARMKEAYGGLKTLFTPAALDALKSAALSLKSRAGTFGYMMASDVARLLHLFLGQNFRASNSRHLIVIEKHIDVLMVIFAKNIREREGLGVELYSELERLIRVHT